MCRRIIATVRSRRLLIYSLLTLSNFSLVFGGFESFTYSQAISETPELLQAWHRYRDEAKLSDLASSLMSFYSRITSPDFLKSFWESEQLKNNGSDPRGLFSTISPQCVSHLSEVFEGLLERRVWALKMLDAWGKPPSGILEVNLRSYGNFRECKGIDEKIRLMGDTIHVKGKYCLADLKIFQDDTDTVLISATEGMCFPDGCLEEDVKIMVDHFLNVTDTSDFFKSVSVACHEDMEINSKAIGSLVFFGVFFMIVLIGTFLDAVLKKSPQQPGSIAKGSETANSESLSTSINAVEEQQPPSTSNEYQPLISVNSRGSKARENTAVKVFLCFSLKTNFEKLFDVSTSNADTIECLHGMRFFTIAWIIVGHTILMVLARAENFISFAEKYASNPVAQVFVNGTFACDSFLTFSGLLVCYNLLKAMDHVKGKMKWHLFYLHRYLRLTPPMMLVMFLYATTYQYWQDAPIWPQKGLEDGNQCEDTWWLNIFYINNFFRQQCMPWTWYLAVDTQLYVISPIFIVLLYRKPKIGLLTTALALAASMVCTAVIVYMNHLPPSGYVVMEANLTVHGDAFVSYYYATYCRMGPYLIGIFAGYILYKTKKELSIHWLFNIMGWALTFVISTSIICGLTRATILTTDTVPLTLVQSVIYLSLGRPAFSLCVAWVLVMCATGNAGPVNKLLAMPVFRPFGRATYMTYLLHEILLVWFVRSQETPLTVSGGNFMVLFIAFIIGSYGVAFVGSLIFEAPFMAVEKLIFAKVKV